jgi:hypothetical protein
MQRVFFAASVGLILVNYYLKTMSRYIRPVLTSLIYSIYQYVLSFLLQVYESTLKYVQFVVTRKKVANLQSFRVTASDNLTSTGFKENA